MDVIDSDGTYSIIDASDNLNQGDLLQYCPYTFQPIGEYYSTKKGTVAKGTIKIKIGLSPYSIIMTNSCDMDWEKVEEIMLAPVTPLETHIAKFKPKHFKDENEEAEWEKDWNNFRHLVKNKRMPRYHLLDELCRIKGHETKEPLLIDFGYAYRLRLDFIKSFAEKDANNSPRLTLSSVVMKEVLDRFSDFFYSED